jgi:flavin-dependent dehydrogenase
MASGDIVIVGGGPAGLATAISLVQQAPALRSRVVLLEKATYPREKICAGGLGDRGWKVLESLEATPDVPCVPINAFNVITGEGCSHVRPGKVGRVIRRIEFDHALAEIARKKGVHIEEGARVKAVRDLGSEAEVETQEGMLRAAVVVGADGVGSVVRRSLGVERGDLRAMVLEVDTEAAHGDPERDVLQFDISDHSFNGYIWDFPTLVDGEPLWCRGIYVLRIHRGAVPKVPDVKVDLAARLGEHLAAKGLDIAACRNKQFAERGYERATAVVGGRRILVGEAVGIDPITGEGIAPALEFGALAGRFLAEVVEQGRDLSDWQRVVRRSRIAFDLGIRRSLVGPFFGRRRRRTERILVRSPDLLYAAAEHFAGRRPGPMRLMRAMAQAGTAALSRLGPEAGREET